MNRREKKWHKSEIGANVASSFYLFMFLSRVSLRRKRDVIPSSSLCVQTCKSGGQQSSHFSSGVRIMVEH